MTGYQADRDRDELTKILQAYIAEELQPYLKLFPHEFFKQIHRLHGWAYTEDSARGPRYVGKLINKYIYDRLPADVGGRLRELSPPVNGRRKTKLSQYLTGHTGIPALDKQIISVTTLLAVSDDKAQFEALLKKRFPKPGDQTDIPGTSHAPDADDDE